MSAKSRLVNGFSKATNISLVLKETPSNSGLTYKGPKVAEFLGR